MISVAVASYMTLILTACGVSVTGLSLPDSVEMAVGDTEKIAVDFLDQKCYSDYKDTDFIGSEVVYGKQK